MDDKIKISDVKKEYENTKFEEYMGFIQKYSKDSRSGIQNIVNRCNKKILKYNNELQRIEKMKEYEYAHSNYKFICGIDEVGRGPLAGPVCAGAVILDKNIDILYLNDSKQLSPKKRDELYEEIVNKAVAFKTAFVSPEKIDEINILQATYKAMREAITNLNVKPDILLNDAVTIPGINIKQVPIIKGDTLSISIAAASIVAKVERDRLMIEYDKLYPEYGFADNKGYGSEKHIEAIKKYGPCPIHRMSFLKGLM